MTDPQTDVERFRIPTSIFQIILFFEDLTLMTDIFGKLDPKILYAIEMRGKRGWSPYFYFFKKSKNEISNDVFQF